MEKKIYTYRLIERKVKPQVRIEAFDKKTLSQVYVKDIILPQPKKEVYSTDARG
ncbi:MAG: hypothetical protein IPJ32_06425 [Sphingobacteriaceae bacterium]|nr:hypothetical protein [Sphingobacteriaceae bacterium]